MFSIIIGKSNKFIDLLKTRNYLANLSDLAEFDAQFLQLFFFQVL
jgi:hypothetical protein